MDFMVLVLQVYNLLIAASLGNEDVRIFQNGFNVIALKLQGDSSVPAGQITWKGTLHMDKKSGRGLVRFLRKSVIDSISDSMCWQQLSGELTLDL